MHQIKQPLFSLEGVVSCKRYVLLFNSALALGCPLKLSYCLNSLIYFQWLPICEGVPRPISVPKQRISLRIQIAADWRPDPQAVPFKECRYIILWDHRYKPCQPPEPGDLRGVSLRLQQLQQSGYKTSVEVPFWKIPMSWSEARRVQRSHPPGGVSQESTELPLIYCFQMINLPCFRGVSSTWSSFIILFIRYWIKFDSVLLRICGSSILIVC